MGHISNIAIGLLAVLAGAAMLVWIIPAQTVPAIFATVPSDFYSDFTSWMLVASGAGLLLSGVLAPLQLPDARKSWRQAAVFLAAVVLLTGATLAVAGLGFLYAGFGIVLVTLLLMGERRWPVLAIVTVAIPVLIWAAFTILLGRPLP